jgi:hypothetical protein
VIFEPSGADNADADRFSAAIESGLKDFHRVKLVNRMELDIIKREIGLWMSEYIDPNHKMQPKLRPAMLIFYLKVIQEDSKPLILMRLLNTGQGTIQEVFVQKVERHTSLADQKNQLSEIGESWTNNQWVNSRRYTYKYFQDKLLSCSLV